MAGGKIEVQIGADKSDFDKKIKEVEFDIKELSKIKLEKLRLGLDTTEINAQIKDAKNNLNQLKTAVKDTGATIGGQFRQQTANGGAALTQFSRIVQDAPFGIIGIGNNITATAEAFGNLKNSTGSASGAFKAIASSLTGTGGILLGVSLLTTGLTYLAQSGLSVSDVINKLLGNTDAYSDALKKINEEAFASESVQQAITNVNQLSTEINLAKDGFLNKDQVVKHYNETIGKTTGLVNNIEEAEKSLAKNADAYIRMTLYKAAATLALQEAAKSQLEAEKTRVKKLQEFANFSDKVTIASSELEDTEANKAFVREQNKKRLIDLQKKRKLEEIKINENAAKVNLSIAKKFEQDAAKIAKDFNFNFFGDTEAPKKKKPKKTKFEFDATFIAPFVSTISGLGDTLDGFEQRAFQAFENASGYVKDGTDKMKLIMQEFSAAVNELAINSISQAFSNIGFAIGEALASGGNVLSAVGQTLLQALSGFLSQLGDKLIQYGLMLAAFGKAELAFTVGDPLTKIGAGAAMIALGIAAKAAAGMVSAFGGGGLRGAGGGGGGATANNQSFTSSGFSGGGGGGTVVFEIAGTKLIGVLSNTINANKRLGGQLGIG